MKAIYFEKENPVYRLVSTDIHVFVFGVIVGSLMTQVRIQMRIGDGIRQSEINLDNINS